jgi:2-amino-4-hydroxy-6-hydroxymethyldihydropteridine diphosphokinase
MPAVYIALGSNVGDREANLREAIGLLSQSGMVIRRVSSLYETAPVDYLDQAWFLNAALEGQTNLPAVRLLTTLRNIESQMGNKKPFPKGPRLIDLDMLLYGEETIATPDLEIPHPRMLLRNFVLVPLAEVAPSLRHPSWPASAAELLLRSPDRSEVKKYQPRSAFP